MKQTNKQTNELRWEDKLSEKLDNLYIITVHVSQFWSRYLTSKIWIISIEGMRTDQIIYHVPRKNGCREFMQSN